MVYFKENYCFPRFQRGSIVFQGGGGGGVEMFSGVGVKVLISVETDRTYEFPGGVQTLSHLWICACTHFLEFKVIFLAPYNYVETHCT